jgi:hypothetical protein
MGAGGCAAAAGCVSEAFLFFASACFFDFCFSFCFSFFTDLAVPVT